MDLTLLSLSIKVFQFEFSLSLSFSFLPSSFLDSAVFVTEGERPQFKQKQNTENPTSSSGQRKTDKTRALVN